MTLQPDAVTAERLLHENRIASLSLRVLAGARGLSSPITNPRLQKPGLALAGFMEYVKPGRVQVIGSSEAQYLATLPARTAEERAAALVALQPPLVVICKAMEAFLLEAK